MNLIKLLRPLNNQYTTKHFSKQLPEVNTIMRYLNVAEKNDAAKNISAILSRGGSSRREGFSQYNKIYEFDCAVMGRQVHMVFTSVSGHLMNYDFPVAFRKWSSCSPLALFDAPVVKSCMEDSLKIKRTLEREIRTCEALIIWTDCDREGENIGFEVIKVCTDVKPNIQVYRARFSEITGPSVFRALNNLGQPDKKVSDAVDVRQELDLRTGAAFTRLQTIRLQKAFPQKLNDKLISYGSCQFPTLGFVVERYKAIEEFISEKFWKIRMSHTISEITTDFNWKRGRLFSKTTCEAILDMCQENPLARIESVERKSKSKWRPLPLDTIEMEKTVSKKLRINAKDCMKIAEKLYTQGFISYPRTETNIFPKELNLTNLVEMQTDDNNWGPFARRIMAEGGPTPRQGRKSDQAHPPIHPTKYTNSLGGNEQRLYEYIVRHFLACVHKDAQGFETTICADIAGEKFVAKGLLILEKNYLDVYVYEKWNAKEVYGYEEGDTFQPTVLDLVDGQTTPPSLLTEADLIALMDKHGIGTDATHADHIDTIKSREYVGLYDNVYFVPVTLGMGLVEGYNNIGLEVSLAKPNLRAEFESDLKLICDGVKDPEVVRREQIEKYKAVFRTCLEKINELDTSLATRLGTAPERVQQQDTESGDEFRPARRCPRCGQDMIVRTRKQGHGKFLSCVAFPECKHAIWLPTCVDSVVVLDEHCEVCGPDVKKLKIQFRQNMFPGEPNPGVYCLGGCDTVVLETMDISLASVRNQNPRDNVLFGSPPPQPPQPPPPPVPPAPPRRAPQRPPQNPITSRTINARTNDFDNQRRNDSFSDGRFDTSANRNVSLMIPGPSRSNGNIGVDDDNNVVCSCNKEAVLLTVRKEGPNTGRKFYKCQLGPSSGGCNFFQWASEPENGNTSTRTIPTNEIKCNCHLLASLRTVQKEGPNKGRQFYSCGKPFGEKNCNFFKWLDDTGDMGSSHSGDDGRGGGGAPNPKWGKGGGKAPKRAKGKCSICGQEGIS